MKTCITFDKGSSRHIAVLLQTDTVHSAFTCTGFLDPQTANWPKDR